MNTNSTRIASVVQQLQDNLKGNIRCINAGGCGYFALMVHKELKSYGIDSKMMLFLGTWEPPMEERYQMIEDIKNNGIENCSSGDPRYLSFSHTFVRIEVGKGRYFDFDAKHMNYRLHKWWQRDMDDIIGGHYDEEHMKYALKYGGWNYAYDTKQNTTLKRIIKQSLKALNDEN